MRCPPSIYIELIQTLASSGEGQTARGKAYQRDFQQL